jgi:hypothetical protein
MFNAVLFQGGVGESVFHETKTDIVMVKVQLTYRNPNIEPLEKLAHENSCAFVYQSMFSCE